MCQAGTSIVYLQNTTGYMVGTEAERRGIVKHGSKMIQAVANASVPQLTLHIGASFGAGNYGMWGDRESGVEGKRVDLGGRRIIKKKKDKEEKVHENLVRRV